MIAPLKFEVDTYYDRIEQSYGLSPYAMIKQECGGEVRGHYN